MNTFKNFFENNKHKILGEEVLRKDFRSGENIFVVEGGLEYLEKIDVVSSFVPKKGIGLENINVKDITEIKQKENLQAAHRAVVEKKAKKSNTKKVKRKKAVDFAKMRFIPGLQDPDLITFDESIKSLNSELNEGFLKAWVFYKKTKNFPIHSSFNDFYEDSDEYIKGALEDGFLCYDPIEKFIPSVIYYSGNIYTRIRDLQEGNTQVISKEQKQKQLEKLKSIIPEPLRINDSVENRLNLNWQSLFIKRVSIRMFSEDISLYDAFWEYISSLDNTEFKFQTEGNGNHMDQIIRQRIQFKTANWNFRNYNEKDKSKYKEKSTEELNFQMFKFLTEVIRKRDLIQIEKKWNIEHNGYVEPNYNLIPIGFEHNTKFKDAPLEIRKAQKEGVSFMDISGNGIIAYDVGVGKTMTSILAVGNALSNGQCKRPVIIVPNPTYYKWLAEIRGTYDSDGNVISEGILPQYKINNFYNLGEPILKEIWDEEKGLIEPIEDYSITLLTFSAINVLGFSPDLGDGFKNEVAGIITQKAERTVKEKTSDENEAIKMVSKGKKGQLVWIDQADWDYVVIDEAHNMNKIFRSVENNDDKEKSRIYSFKQQGVLPVRAIKSFFLTRYIQNQNNNRNVCLLTATPFNNSPLEVFSILALADLPKLKKLNLGSLRTFFDEYIFTTYEKVVRAGNKVETKQVIKGWNNKVSLQNVMFSIMNYKSGDDIDELQRPNKFVFPKISEVSDDGTVRVLEPSKQKKTYLFPSPQQSDNFAELDEWFKMAKQDEDLKVGADLVLLGRGKSNTFSPHSYYITANFSDKEIKQSEKDALTREYVKTLDPIDVIEESPKLKYTMECIKSIREHHKANNSELGCIIIYSNTGKALFGKIKDYLIDEIGYKREAFKPSKKIFSEVEIISGDTNVNDKEFIKEGFNSGKIKVVIGSATIREGIDLQKKTTTVFSLYNEYNPTSYKQLEGRAYRQGNQYANVRIVTPLLIDSSDAFIWQKMEEKTGRINDIFDRKDKTNILDVNIEEREAIKWSIMQDLEAIAKEMISEEVEDKKLDIAKAEANLKEVESLSTTKTDKDYHYEQIRTKAERYRDLDLEENSKSTFLEIYERLSTNKSIIHEKVKNPITNKSDFYGEFSNSKTLLKAYYKAEKVYDRTVAFIKANYGDNMIDKVSDVIEQVKVEVEYLKETELKKLESNAYLEDKVFEISEQRKKLKAGATTFAETVKIFTDTNYLLDELAEQSKSEIELYKDAIEGMYDLVEVTDDEKLKQLYLDAIEGMQELITTFE